MLSIESYRWIGCAESYRHIHGAVQELTGSCAQQTGMKAQARIQQRYGKRLGLTCTGEDLVRHVARALFNGQIETGAQRMLKDFRTGVIGRYALEHPA